jgi:hypothetical protein
MWRDRLALQLKERLEPVMGSVQDMSEQEKRRKGRKGRREGGWDGAAITAMIVAEHSAVVGAGEVVRFVVGGDILSVADPAGFVIFVPKQ